MYDVPIRNITHGFFIRRMKDMLVRKDYWKEKQRNVLSVLKDRNISKLTKRVQALSMVGIMMAGLMATSGRNIQSICC